MQGGARRSYANVWIAQPRSAYSFSCPTTKLLSSPSPVTSPPAGSLDSDAVLGDVSGPGMFSV